MRVLDLAIKDLQQILRDRRSLLFLVAMPVVFTMFMGLAYRGSLKSSAAEDTRIPLAVVDPEPEAQLNKMLAGRLASSDSIKVSLLSEDEALQQLQAHKVAGVLMIPAGFSRQAEAGSAAQLTLLAEAGSSEGQSLYQLLRVPVSELMSAVEIARMSADVTSKAAELSPALKAAWAKWTEASNVSLVKTEQAAAPETGPSDWTGGNPYNQASPGILVQFAIFGLINSATIIVQERKTRTLQRLRTTAMKPWQIVGGHLLAMFALTIMQMLMLVIFGQLALQVQYLRQPIGILLVCVALGCWVGSMGLLIGVMAKGEEQVVLFSMIAMFIFSALGGTWFPLEAAGGVYAAIGRLMPSAWAMNGFQNILIRGLGMESVWKPVSILLLYAAGFFALAAWRFGKAEA
jgi:ABC-2 type transport system permease protein